MISRLFLSNTLLSLVSGQNKKDIDLSHKTGVLVPHQFTATFHGVPEFHQITHTQTISQNHTRTPFGALQLQLLLESAAVATTTCHAMLPHLYTATAVSQTIILYQTQLRACIHTILHTLSE